MTGTHRAILDALVSAYGLGNDATCEPLGHGLINRTLLLRSGNRCYVAQRINRQVFPRPGALVANARIVEQALRQSADYPLQVTRQLAGENGRYLHGPAEDIRLMAYVENSVSLEFDPNPVQAEQAAAAYGRFNACLADLEATRLETVIPDFHHLDRRRQQLPQRMRRRSASHPQSSLW